MVRRPGGGVLCVAVLLLSAKIGIGESFFPCPQFRILAHSLIKIGVALVDDFRVYQLVCRPWKGGNIIAVN
jgi:hypothetical protein